MHVLSRSCFFLERVMPCELDPDAPVFTPPSKTTLKSETFPLSSSPRSSKEPQCSRYSRRSVRQLSLPVSPRPILGTKLPFPRPILGRKEEPVRDEADEYIGREFRNLNRTFQRMRVGKEGTSQQKEDSLV